MFMFAHKLNKPMRHKTQGVRQDKVPPLAVDLFAGCGGLTQGLKSAGFKVVAALDIDHLAAETYRANHPEVHFIEKDIRAVSGVELLQGLGIETGALDVLAGCPPCQGFSTLRTKNSGKAVKDDRNDLVLEFLRFVQEIKPQSVMLENVPGLATDRRFSRFRKGLRELGYIGKKGILDVSQYGVPQRRNRLIFLATLTKRPSLAKPNKGGVMTVRDAISELAPPGNSGDALHDLKKRHTNKVKQMIKRIPKDGGSRSSLPEAMRLDCHKKCDGFKDVYGRMKWDDVAPTITSGCTNPSKGRFLHPEQNRAITLREASILQGFPKLYKFPVMTNKGAIALMIGNALPPPFVAAHAKILLEILALSRTEMSNSN